MKIIETNFAEILRMQSELIEEVKKFDHEWKNIENISSNYYTKLEQISNDFKDKLDDINIIVIEMQDIDKQIHNIIAENCNSTSQNNELKKLNIMLDILNTAVSDYIYDMYYYIENAYLIVNSAQYDANSNV